MGQVHSEILPGRVQSSNMSDYAEAVANFEWEDVERNFSWYETGKVNILMKPLIAMWMKGGERQSTTYSDTVRKNPIHLPICRSGRTGSEMYCVNMASVKEIGYLFLCLANRNCISVC